MTMNIPTILRHWFTLLATLLSGWLLLPAEQQTDLSKALGDMVGPLTVVLTLVLTAGWRIALAGLGKFLGSGRKPGSPGGLGMLMMMGALAVFAMALPACSPAQLAAAREVPVRGCVETDAGTVCYSRNSGLSYAVDTRSAK